MNSRRQALKLCFDATVVVVIQIGYEFLFEVCYRIEILEIEQFALQQTEEIFNYSIIKTVAFSAHALNNAVISQLFLIMLVLILPSLIGVQNGSCPRGQPARGIIDHIHDH